MTHESRVVDAAAVQCEDDAAEGKVVEGDSVAHVPHRRTSAAE